MTQIADGANDTGITTHDHMRVLAQHKYVDGGLLMNLTAGTQRIAPILRQLKEGKHGRLTVGQDWIEIRHCPICGVRLDSPEAALPSTAQFAPTS